ncbi:hypothetical protein [Bernardetia sp. MNP-M8]|uniref:hypothetical protein n=1 Tax=Bernardetia sp. MNP-M8 TaxID=3127470 RepID=UPI0030D0A155
MFTPIKSNAIKFILSASIIVGGLSSCASEAVEETRQEVFVEESAQSENLAKINIDPTPTDFDTVLYPIDPLVDDDKDNKKNTNNAAIEIAGSWDMTSTNEQNVDYNLELYKDGTYQASPDEIYTRGRTTGNWNVDGTGDELYLYLGGLYDYNDNKNIIAEPSTRNKFKITEYSDNRLVIVNDQNDSFILTRSNK